MLLRRLKQFKQLSAYELGKVCAGIGCGKRLKACEIIANKSYPYKPKIYLCYECVIKNNQ